MNGEIIRKEYYPNPHVFIMIISKNYAKDIKFLEHLACKFKEYKIQVKYLVVTTPDYQYIQNTVDNLFITQMDEPKNAKKEWWYYSGPIRRKLLIKTHKNDPQIYFDLIETWIRQDNLVVLDSYERFEVVKDNEVLHSQ